MNNSLPYKVEYSVGEQNCRMCEKKIRSGCLKVAIMMQSEDDDCEYPEWYHLKCFFKVRLPKTEAAFSGFAKLRYVDQQAIKVQLGIVENESKKVQKVVTKLPDFGIEYTRSERDSCAGCKQMIRLLEIRVMKVVYNTDLTVENSTFSTWATWYHIQCFVRLRHELSWLESAELLPGFKRLSEKDKEMVKRQIPIIKRKCFTSIAYTDKNLADLEKCIETQNKEYYELYDKLAKNVSKKDQIEILENNFQYIPETKYEILHQLTDTLYFGALSACSKCHTGKMYFNNTVYSCSTSNRWGKCDNDVKEPKRLSAYVLYAQTKKYPFLNAIYRVRTRALHSFRFVDENGIDLVNVPHKNPPLFNMEFALIGKPKMPKQNMEKAIRKLGGRIVNGINDKVAAVISNQEEIEKMGPKMIEAKTCNIQVISEDYLSVAETVDPYVYILCNNLAEWGGNPYSRIEQTVVKSRRETIYYTKSLPEKIRYKLNDNGHNFVDPESGLQEKAHIYCGELNGNQFQYIIVLGLVDIQQNKNSYHRMQLLESDEYNSYWIFESWGRISTLIGKNRLTNYATLDEARTKFHTIYFEKTGEKLGIKSYTVKWPNKFFHLNIDFDFTKSIPKTHVESKLSKPIFELMQLIFDTKHMKQMMLSCDIDLKQMPLGKINSNQIHAAMTVLKNIAKLIIQNGTPAQLRDASNEFYTMIPHGFSIKRPPVIDSIDMVKIKSEMLESLLNMGMINGFLEGENGEKINPLDACYHKMKTEIHPLDKNATEFKRICEIVRNTHGETHNGYWLEVLDIFKVKRKREDVRSRTYKKLDNHQILWHGSRLTNFVSILSKGLRIAPKEAPSTGYMFGKGIYFADVVSKSANYCYPSHQGNIGLMLLCDVALGNTRNPQYACDTKDLPNENEQSVKGCGQVFPTEYSSIDGVKVACGGLRKANFPTSLQYNEYVVYDIAQAKMKYLVKLKFHYK